MREKIEGRLAVLREQREQLAAALPGAEQQVMQLRVSLAQHDAAIGEMEELLKPDPEPLPPGALEEIRAEVAADANGRLPAGV